MSKNQETKLVDTFNSLPELQHLHAGCINITETDIGLRLPIALIQDKIHSLVSTDNTTPAFNIKQDIPTFQALKTPHPKVKNIIAIASGKGGVGKSTVTYFLAHALQKMGAKCGVLDADIYGPSQAFLFDIDENPQMQGKQYMPFIRQGIQVMSIGVLANSNKALMWRGPMISQALMQLYQQTLWEDLDYLLVDLPPGTGDISLTLLQKMPVTASILVSNPHPLAEMDVKRCQYLFQTLCAPILTTVMNMEAPSQLRLSTENPFTLLFDQKFRDQNPIAHPEFLQLAHVITSRLCHLPIYQPNPFDQFQVDRESS